jgi:hypothetical protein
MVVGPEYEYVRNLHPGVRRRIFHATLCAQLRNKPHLCLHFQGAVLQTVYFNGRVLSAAAIPGSRLLLPACSLRSGV